MLHNVAVVVLDNFEAFELGVVCEVFGLDRSDDGLPIYDFAVVAGEPGPLRCQAGFTIQAPHNLERLEEADLIAVPAVSDRRLAQGDLIAMPEVPDRHTVAAPADGHARGAAQFHTGLAATDRSHFPEPLLAALRRAADRGAWVLSVCSGVFVLGEAGLLDGRRCTTHWLYAAELARRYPSAKVDPDVLYVDEQPVITSAGTAAGIDACLHLVRKEQGSRVANGIARRMVVPPHRDGGQAQYINRPLAERPGGSLSDVLDWMVLNLERALSVGELAARAHMSPRTFARRFMQETGTTPMRWLTCQRILLAQQLLEDTDETVDAIAERVGFGNAAALRHHFRAWRDTTPDSYRRLFRGPAGAGLQLPGAREHAAAPAG
ncbi:MAG TPA: helix-turn-helix domain-containing protein [Streptosporangiaceae bacterium]|jgi:transcriptional regulator GlxA family with amidase domain|nr:helix-turn-helix domain-containing protein [Streptosporangiaceae bacterium]